MSDAAPVGLLARLSRLFRPAAPTPDLKAELDRVERALTSLEEQGRALNALLAEDARLWAEAGRCPLCAARDFFPEAAA